MDERAPDLDCFVRRESFLKTRADSSAFIICLMTDSAFLLPRRAAASARDLRNVTLLVVAFRRALRSCCSWIRRPRCASGRVGVWVMGGVMEYCWQRLSLAWERDDPVRSSVIHICHQWHSLRAFRRVGDQGLAYLEGRRRRASWKALVRSRSRRSREACREGGMGAPGGRVLSWASMEACLASML